jgi:hypothetical protein
MDASPQTVTVELTLRIGAEPIAGELRTPATPPRPFVGWVALVRSVEEAMNAVDPEESP